MPRALRPSSAIGTSESRRTSTPGRRRRPSASFSTRASRTRSARSMTARPSWTTWSRNRNAASRSRPRRPPASGRGWTNLPRAPHQHHRHARATSTSRSKSSAACACSTARCAVLRGGRRAAAVRDGVAADEPVQRAAHRVRQQDGPRRRELPALRATDPHAPARQPGADPAAHRRRRQLRRRRRPHPDEGDLLGHGNPGHEVRVPRDPGGAQGRRPRNTARR